MGHVLNAEKTTWHGVGPTQGEGIIRRLDPRVRILAVAGFAIGVILLNDLVALSTALAIALIAMALAELPPARTLRRMIMMDSFIIFMLALLPFTVPGDPIFTVAGFPASWQGLLKAAQIGLKANAVVLMLMSLVGTMESGTLGHALHRLRFPEALIHLLLFTVRYIDVMHQEYLTLRTAMKARGFRPANSRHTYRTFGYLIGMLLVRSVERSERILNAMKCRGFTGRIPIITTLAYHRRDGLFAGLAILVMVGLVALEMMHVATF